MQPKVLTGLNPRHSEILIQGPQGVTFEFLLCNGSECVWHFRDTFLTLFRDFFSLFAQDRRSISCMEDDFSSTLLLANAQERSEYLLLRNRQSSHTNLQVTTPDSFRPPGDMLPQLI